jgi:hypothetical protein
MFIAESSGICRVPLLLGCHSTLRNDERRQYGRHACALSVRVMFSNDRWQLLLLAEAEQIRAI